MAVSRKFERRRREMVRKHQAELEALEATYKEELQRKIEPIVSKIAQVAEEEARRLLESDPELLDGYSFRKREAAKTVREALEELFREGGEEDAPEADPEGASEHLPNLSRDGSGASASSGNSSMRDASDPFDDVAPGAVAEVVSTDPNAAPTA